MLKVTTKKLDMLAESDGWSVHVDYNGDKVTAKVSLRGHNLITHMDLDDLDTLQDLLCEVLNRVHEVENA